jgi:hypothetical protein
VQTCDLAGSTPAVGAIGVSTACDRVAYMDEQGEGVHLPQVVVVPPVGGQPEPPLLFMGS